MELVHHMGGSIRKDFSTRVTHLVANYTGGEKYRVGVPESLCMSLCLPICLPMCLSVCFSICVSVGNVLYHMLVILIFIVSSGYSSFINY